MLKKNPAAFLNCAITEAIASETADITPDSAVVSSMFDGTYLAVEINWICGKAMIEVRFHGRGGQDAKIASRILGRSGFLSRLYVQDFALFGAERRGARRK